MDLRQVFAANLRRLRHAKGLSQQDLAYEADVNRTYMSKLEKGGSYFVGLEIIGKLAAVLGSRASRFIETASKEEKRVAGDRCGTSLEFLDFWGRRAT